jgi:hypothetical protein
MADLQAYTTLAKYSILAASAITTVNPLTVTNGTYGNPPATYSGTIIGTVDSGNATVAQTELTALVGAINGLTPTSGSLPSPVAGIIKFTPGVYTPGTSITIGNASDSNIVFDAQGNSNATFYIISSSFITLNNITSVTLINGANPCNIYWLADSAITMTGTVPLNMYGILIGGSQVTFANGLIVNGPVFAQTADVTFSGIGTPFVIGCNPAPPIPPTPPTPPTPLPPICFVKGTNIMTNRGFIPIEDITPSDSVVTSGVISNKGIVTATGLMKTPIVFIGHFSEDNLTEISRPIVISKDALGKGIPFEDVRVSPNHAIVVDNRTIHAKDLVDYETIYQDMDCESVEYYHIMAQNHFTLNASGMWSESLKGCVERFTSSMAKNLGVRNNTRVIKKNSIHY